MSSALLGLVAVAYLYVAIDYAYSARWGMSLAFAAYALSNIGFMIDLWRSTPAQ